MTSYRQKTADLRAELRVLHKLNPETAKGFSALSMGALADGPVDKKTREFADLAIAITQPCEPCINLHVEALMYAAHALAAWDEFTQAA